MRKYEIMFILDQDAKDVAATAKKLNDILTADGGKIIESAEWGLKDFAYEINHKKKGFYYIVIVDTKPANITEFRRIAGIDKDVVREFVMNTENEKHYIQSTKMSKTDMSKFKEERKPRTFEKRDRFVKPEEGKAESAAPKAEKPVVEKEAAPKAEKPTAEKKPAAKKEAALKAEKPAAEKKPAAKKAKTEEA
jgi:small subunit ribosomal protein S6